MEQMTFTGSCAHNCSKFRSNPFAKSGNIARVCNNCGCDIQDHTRAAVTEKDVLKALESNEKVPSLIVGSRENGLYQGGWQAAMNQTHLVDSNVGLVINTAGGLDKHFPRFRPEPLYKRLDIKTICFNWEDSSSTTFTIEDMRTAHDAIKSTLVNGKSVLVHCAQGRSRSGSVVVYYISQSEETSIHEALKMVQEKRAMSQPNEHFMTLLHDMSRAGAGAVARAEEAKPSMDGKREVESMVAAESAEAIEKERNTSAIQDDCLHTLDQKTTASAEPLDLVEFTKPAHDQPVLFLDIDGVLCSAGAKYALPGRRTFDPGAVSALQGLIAASKAAVVLTSSWRKRQTDMVQARRLLEDAGIPLVGSTPVIERQRRDEEIVAWLSAHGCASPWTVLDDSPHKFAGAEKVVVTKRLVLVDSSKRLTCADARRALKTLKQ